MPPPGPTATPCLFCDIAARKVPATIVFENEHVVAFRDIRPVAPVHALVVPREHLSGIESAKPTDALVLGHLLLGAKDVAASLGLGGGYRLVINQGADAGQSVFHVHCHVMGGRPMAWPPG